MRKTVSWPLANGSFVERLLSTLNLVRTTPPDGEIDSVRLNAPEAIMPPLWFGCVRDDRPLLRYGARCGGVAFYSNNCNDLHTDRRTVWRSGVQ